jgi:hypothetical protein
VTALVSGAASVGSGRFPSNSFNASILGRRCVLTLMGACQAVPRAAVRTCHWAPNYR